MIIVIRTKLRRKPRATRYAAQKIWLSQNTLPFPCAACSAIVKELGRKKEQGNIHHINEDIYDNRVENLQLVCVSCHHSRHHKGAERPNQGVAAAKRWTGIAKSTSHKNKLRDRATQQWSDPDSYMKAYAARWPGLDPLVAWNRRQKRISK